MAVDWYRTSKCKGWSVRQIYDNTYTLHWSRDFHYTDSMLRHPRGWSRTTDRKGAERFAKKHGVEINMQAPARGQERKT